MTSTIIVDLMNLIGKCVVSGNVKKEKKFFLKKIQFKN